MADKVGSPSNSPSAPLSAAWPRVPLAFPLAEKHIDTFALRDLGNGGWSREYLVLQLRPDFSPTN